MMKFKSMALLLMVLFLVSAVQPTFATSEESLYCPHMDVNIYDPHDSINIDIIRNRTNNDRHITDVTFFAGESVQVKITLINGHRLLFGIYPERLGWRWVNFALHKFSQDRTRKGCIYHARKLTNLFTGEAAIDKTTLRDLSHGEYLLVLSYEGGWYCGTRLDSYNETIKLHVV